MKVLKIEGILAIIKCDCGIELNCKKFIWETICYSCSKKFRVSELVAEYMAEQAPKMGRPIGSKDSFPRIRIDNIDDAEITDEMRDRAHRVVTKFSMNYDLKKIAEQMKKYRKP